MKIDEIHKKNSTLRKFLQLLVFDEKNERLSSDYLGEIGGIKIDYDDQKQARNS